MYHERNRAKLKYVHNFFNLLIQKSANMPLHCYKNGANLTVLVYTDFYEARIYFIPNL